jgi:uroporphyrin-III C-methyltransferase/precorrin-2 dehydrogenase/sirohydrochlorin ferrochelatase
MADEALYPIFLKLEDRKVLVVGAGAQAERKIGAALEAGAEVRVVALGATGRVQEWAKEGEVAWEARPFVDADVDGAWLVVAATSDTEVQRAVAAACAARRVFCVAVDDPANASAYSGSVLRRPPFTIAISSSGEAPGLTRLLREVLEGALPPDEWVARARALRRKWKAERTPMTERFAELVRGLTSKP